MGACTHKAVFLALKVGTSKGKSFGCFGLFPAMIPIWLPCCHKIHRRQAVEP